MKNRKYLMLVGLVAASAASTSYAALVGSITLSGTVPASTAITVTTVAGYNSLDLTTTHSNTLVANVNESNNTALGYKVTLASTNAGLLKNGTIGSLTYTAQYNGANVTLSTSPVVVTNAAASNTIVNATKALTISYTGQSATQMMAGTYTDTLTFTIAAN